MTQAELSSKTNIVVTQLHAYLNGKNTPGIDKVELFANALGVPLADLFSGEPLDIKQIKAPPAHIKLELISTILQASDKKLDIFYQFLSKIS